MVRPLAHRVVRAPPALASFLGLRSLSSTLSFLAGDFFLVGIFNFGCGLRSWHRAEVMTTHFPLEGESAPG
jgi:hypothetical protein